MLEIFWLSGIKPKLNEELNIIHSKGVYTKEIEDPAMEGFMPSIPGEVEFFSNEDISSYLVLFPRRRLVMNKVEGEASYDLGIDDFFCQ